MICTPSLPPVRRIYLVRDNFDTDTSAPLPSPRTCEPGPGTLTLVQNDGQFSISGAKLVYPAQSTAVWGDLGFRSTASFTRNAGFALLFTVRKTTLGTGNIFGWRTDTVLDVGTGMSSMVFDFIANFGMRLNATGWNIGTAFVTNTDYQCAVVLRNAGAFLLVKGGVFTSWTVLWIGKDESDSPLYVFTTNFDGVGTIDSFRATGLGYPWVRDHGIATDRLAGLRTIGDTFTHTANGIVTYAATFIPTAGNVDVNIRIQDSSNYWNIRGTSAGALTLREVVAGSGTQRATASSAFTSNGQEQHIIFDGTVIRGHANNTFRWTYSGATNFQTRTSGLLADTGTSGQVSDIIAWPRTVESYMPNV